MSRTAADLSNEEKLPAIVMAELFCQFFGNTPGANNYIEICMDSSMGPIVVTARRGNGQSPGSRATELEAALSKLAAAAHLHGMDNSVVVEALAVIEKGRDPA